MRRVLVLMLIAGCAPGGSAPSDRAQMILQDSRYRWTSIETASARIHYPKGSFAERERHALADRVNGALESIKERLSISDYPVTVDVFYVDAREDMERLTGSPVTGFAFTEDQTVVLVYNENWRAFERHELTHVISLSHWGEPGEPRAATLEAFATFVDGDCGGYEIGRLVRTVLERDAALDWESLLVAFRAQDDLIAYLQAASVVQFFYSQGLEADVPRLWSGGLGAAPQLLEVTWSGFESRWSAWLRASQTPISDEAWQRIRAAGCGIDARPVAAGPRKPR